MSDFKLFYFKGKRDIYKMLTLLTLAAFAVFIPTALTAGCRDKYAHCQKYGRFCYSPQDWRAFMKVNCQGTCIDHCKSGGGGGGGSGGTGTGGSGGTGTGGGSGNGSNGKCGISPNAQGRIVAGVDAKPGAWPWMVSLNMRGQSSHFCGGSLISPKWVLTASHCTDGQRASGIDVIIGEHDRYRREGTEQRINVRRIIMHKSFSANNLKYDIALLELERPAQINSRAQLICLPPQGYSPPIGKKCYLAGWGTMTHPGQTAQILQQAMLPVVDKRHCFNDANFICTGYGRSSKINACRGDSGGPLVCQEANGQWVQQGIASFVIEYCKYYTAFARVGDLRNWIRQHTGV